MASHSLAAHYSLGEEIANSVTHGIAALLSIAGLGSVDRICEPLRRRLAHRQLQYLWRDYDIALHRFHALPQHSNAKNQKYPQGHRPFGDLSADCRYLHAFRAG